VDTEAVLRLLQDVAEEVVNPRFRSLSSGEIDEKGPGDLVTAADREAEELITVALHAAYPEAVILGEEAYAGRPALLTEFWGADHAFTVDPVDGTKNFVHGSPDHAVMVGEVKGGEAVRGWIWQPQHRRAYVAELGGGAWRDGERVTRPETPPRSRLRGVTSRRKWLGRSLAADLRPLELTWVSCGIDYPHLAEGDADYVVYGRANPWDHVPGGLRLTEAGGFLGTASGGPYRPRDDHDIDGAAPRALVAAADRATYDAIAPLLRPATR
jgi:fructose-1,6-bisphosphatase/inositol monophosphatase family enzyme